MIATLPQLAPLPSELPAVERSAAIPAGFLAAGGVAGIKASGRPDLAIVATERGRTASRAGRRGRGLHPERVRGRARQAVAGASRGDGAGRRRPLRLGDRRDLDERLGQRRDGAAGDVDQAEIAGILAARPRRRRRRRRSCSRRGSSGRACRSTSSRPGSPRSPAALAAIDDGGLAAAAGAPDDRHAQRRRRRVTIALPDPDGLTVRSIRVTGIAKGVGMIHPRMATMLSIVLTDATVDPATLHGLLAAGRRPDVGPAQRRRRHVHERHGLRARVRDGRAPRRCERGTREAVTLGRAIEAVARDLARQQAADGEGATTLITCQVSGATDDADARAVARAVDLVLAGQGGRPRQGPELGPDRRRRGQRDAGRRGGAGGGRAGRRVRAGTGRDPGDARSRAAPDRDRGPSRVRRPGGRPDRVRSRGGPEGDARPGAADPARSRAWATGTGEAFGCDLTEEYVVENSEYTT